MGKPGHKSTAVVAVDVDEKGEIRYDAIVKQGTNRNRIVQTSLKDLKEKAEDIEAVSLPTTEEEQLTTERTKKALEALLNGKISSSRPVDVSAVVAEKEPSFIRYTADPSAPGYNPALQQRVIKMVEAQVDPMEPPKHAFKKVPKGPPDDPVPVLHSPPRKLTVADQQAWKVPPCISNWKNGKGFIVPLDKRLAADGRGLQEVTINNKFASVSEALYIAERKAAEDLRIRNQIRKKMAMQEKEEHEKELRDMAAKARLERSGVITSSLNPNDRQADQRNSYYEAPRNMDSEKRFTNETHDNRTKASDFFQDEDSEEEFEDKDARLERERLRIEKRKELEREIRKENLKGNAKKTAEDRNEGRDISEKIALGLHKGTGKLSGESMFDSRLFNQSAGISSGFGAEDDYNTYSKPLFDRGEATSIYRPKGNDDDVYGNADAQMSKLLDTSRFKADKGFKGAEGGVNAGPRSEPVQFEKSGSYSYHDDNERSSKRSRYEDNE